MRENDAAQHKHINRCAKISVVAQLLGAVCGAGPLWIEAGTTTIPVMQFDRTRSPVVSPKNGHSHDNDAKTSRDWPGWLAQQCGFAPALLGVPANRKFCNIIASGTPETPNSAAVAGLPMQIPYSTKQGIISAELGILAQEQGILSAGIEIIAG